MTDLNGTGTFVCAYPTEASIHTICRAVMRDAHPDILASWLGAGPDFTSRLHTTLLYSRLDHPEISPVRFDPETAPVATITGITKFGIQRCEESGIEVCALVLTLDCPEFVARHNGFRSEYGATHDFESYEPHMTVAYGVPTEVDFELECPNLKRLIGQTLTYSHEYVEALDLD